MGACPGCGAVQPAIDGATHPYVGASSACWTRFSEINFALPPTPMARLVIDAYRELTIFEVADALGTDDAPDVIERCVRGIWSAWARHHDTVEAWARTYG